MKHLLLVLSLIAAFVAPAGAQDAPQDATPAPKANFSVKKNVQNNLHVFIFEGAADVPDGTTLTCTCEYIKKLLSPNAPENPTEDDYKIFYLPVDSQKAKVEQGKFKATLGYFSKKPYSGDYHCTVSCDPEIQPPEIKDKVTAFSAEIVFTLGSPEQYDKEKAEEEARIKNDYSRATQLLKELKTNFKTFYLAAQPDLTVWKNWLKKWEAGYGEIKDSNDGRFEEAYNIQESDAKYFLRSILVLMEDLKKTYDVTLATPADKRDPFELLEQDACEIEKLINETEELLLPANRADKKKIQQSFDEITAAYNALLKEKENLKSLPEPAKYWGDYSASVMAKITISVFTIKGELGSNAPLTTCQNTIKALQSLLDDYSAIAGKKKQPDDLTKKLEDSFWNCVESLKKNYENTFH